MQRIFAGVKLSVTIALTFILVLVLARTAAAQNAGAQDPPLNFANNFFVTGDYVVAGAQGMNSHLVTASPREPSQSLTVTRVLAPPHLPATTKSQMARRSLQLCFNGRRSRRSV